MALMALISVIFVCVLIGVTAELEAGVVALALAARFLRALAADDASTIAEDRGEAISELIEPETT